MDSMSDLTTGLLNIALLITVVGAGITAALALFMGIVLAIRGLRRNDQVRSLRVSAIMFLIVSADCFVLWALSDAWGNDDPLAAFLAAAGFGLLALGLGRISRDRQKVLAAEAVERPKDPIDQSTQEHDDA